MNDSDFSNFKESPPSSDDFNNGTKPPLKAKSHSGSGSLLHDHSLQAGRMALTVSETVNVVEGFRKELRMAAFIGGIFHDLGKAAAGFQEMIKDYNVKGWAPKNPGYRHEMLSAVIFLANALAKEKWRDNKEVLWAVYLSIIVHHKPFREKSTGKYPKIIKASQWPGGGAFERMYEELLLNADLLKQCWDEIIDVIKSDQWGQELIENGWIPGKLNIPESVDDAISVNNQFTKNYNLSGYRKGIIKQVKYIDNVTKEKSKFISYVRASVTVGDHLSSGNYLFLPPIPDLSKYNLFVDFSPYPFQQNCFRNGSILLRAPTGSGKTEASQHWIQKNQETKDGRLGKVFFVLPFQASINAMFTRLGKWTGYSRGMIGLQHSRAAQILFGIIENEIYQGNRDQVLHNGRKKVKKYHDPWSEFKDIRTKQYDQFSDLLLDKGYQRDYWNSPVKKQINTAAYSIHRLTRENFYPMKVTTPHQLLGTVLQGRGWEVSVQEFEEACFVFDEIHVYDAHLTGLILGMASVLIKEFNAKIMFMSASFPTFLVELIQKYVSPDLSLIELDDNNSVDTEILHKSRHMIAISTKTMTELFSDDNYIEHLLTNDNNLIICNTVSTAQSVYQLIKDHPEVDPNTTMLFHSRFKMEDRKNKEDQIMNIEDNNLKFIVATQVVEVSLDIDLAYGIFEGAPLDALVQRLGRVNRSGDKELEDINITIAQPEGYSHKIYNEDATQTSLNLLSTVENEKISEMKLVELIDELYEQQPWNEQQWADFHRAFGNDKYQNFFRTTLPGTYRKWIDDVIVEKSSMDVLHWADEQEYRERMKNEPLRALDLLIPARINKEDYSIPKDLDQYILGKEWKYDSEFGLHKEEK